MEDRPNPNLTRHSLLDPNWGKFRAVTRVFRETDVIIPFPAGKDGWSAYFLHCGDKPEEFFFVEKPEDSAEAGRAFKATLEGLNFVAEVHQAVSDDALDSGEVSVEAAGEYVDFQDTAGMNQPNEEELVRLQEMAGLFVEELVGRSV